MPRKTILMGTVLPGDPWLQRQAWNAEQAERAGDAERAAWYRGLVQEAQVGGGYGIG